MISFLALIHDDHVGVFYAIFDAGLSFRTTEESLRNAFQGFGQLVEGEKLWKFDVLSFLLGTMSVRFYDYYLPFIYE